MFNLAQFEIGRRDVLKAGGLAAASLLVPARLLAQSWPKAGFTHGVASGEPRATSVLLWTRFVGTGDSVLLAVEVAADAGFANIVAKASASADIANDSCAKVTVDGLVPGRWYFYRFTAPNGSQSVIGRTRTLPVGALSRFNVAVFSCSNMGFGYFNAYAHAAARSDIDLVVHVGDYFYEYKRGEYPDPGKEVAGRDVLPEGNANTLTGYHMRYASYRTDPDLLELHRNFPWIAIWDDHEFANDAWKDGAQHHDPATEGAWADRKAAAKQAHSNWLPVSGKPYDRYDIGDLVSLITLDTRVEGRDHQLSIGAALKGATDRTAALTAFRDGPWSDPKRTLMGMEQEAWAAAQLKASVKAGMKWQLVAQQIVMGGMLTPPAALGWLKPDADKRAKALVSVGVMAGAIGLPGSMDSWDGYRPARTRFLKAAHDARANMVVVSGDSHNAWAYDLDYNGKPVGVEFAGQGVTSPGYESELSADPKLIAAALVAFNPALKWCETSRRGYLTVTFTPEAARGEWVFMDNVRSRSLVTTPGQVATVKRGANAMALI